MNSALALRILTPTRSALLAGVALVVHSAPPTVTRTTSEVVQNYEIGPGTPHSSSVSLSFPMPCGSDIKVAVSIMRAGGTSDVGMMLELNGPGLPGLEGPLVASKPVDATNMMKFHTLSGGRSPLGCNRPWTVRVKSRSGQLSVKTFGSITVKPALNEIEIPAEGVGVILPGETKLLNLGTTEGLPTGSLTVSGVWQAVAPVLMKFELLNPGGGVAVTATGYKSTELQPCCSGHRLLLKHTISICGAGQWHLRVTNMSPVLSVNGMLGGSETHAVITPLVCPASSSGALTGSLLHVLAGTRAGGSVPQGACG